MSQELAGSPTVLDLAPHARKVRALWIEGTGEVRVERVRSIRRPWWSFWDLRAEVEFWRLPNGRLVEARRHAFEIWTFQDCPEDLQDAALAQPDVQVSPSLT